MHVVGGMNGIPNCTIQKIPKFGQTRKLVEFGRFDSEKEKKTLNRNDQMHIKQNDDIAMHQSQ